MKYLFGFIGCGNMGGALAEAVLKQIDAKQVAVCDHFAEKTQYFTQKYGVAAVDATTLAKESKFIFLGAKPQAFSVLFQEIAPALQARSDDFVLITMAAGLPISKIEELVQKHCAIIRIMPNTPVSVGEGMILYTANEAVSEEDLSVFRNALSFAGRLDAISEEKIDAASALSGCGPAFVYLFAEALADGGVECGLPRDKALLYASQTLYGAAKLLLESGKHPGALKDAVCSPGGTTIAGVHALENGAFRACAMDAVGAAYKRTLELKKEN